MFFVVRMPFVFVSIFPIESIFVVRRIFDIRFLIVDLTILDSFILV